MNKQQLELKAVDIIYNLELCLEDGGLSFTDKYMAAKNIMDLAKEYAKAFHVENTMASESTPQFLKHQNS